MTSRLSGPAQGSETMTDADSPTLGSYAILEWIGAGGMSTVHRAIDLRNGQVVAMKLLSPQVGRDPTFKARFRREVRLLQQLQHPNIVPILDFGEVAGQAYIVMPFMASGTLADRMRQGQVPPHEYARMIGQISSALEFAHKAGVVHRDVKPSNLLLDSDGKALLSDFSFAHIDDATSNLTGSAVIGTPAYMSPEQCRGDAVDGRSDQYSLAIMTYQLATGRLPYEAESAIAVAIMHVNDPLPDPRTLNPSLSQEMSELLVRALSKDPRERFVTIEAFNAALQMALTDTLKTAGEWKRRFHLPGIRPGAFARSNGTSATSRRRSRRLSAAALGIVLLVGSPLAAWALAGGAAWEALNGQPSTSSATPTGYDLMATVNALSTENAPPAGTAMAVEQIETAVYGTLAAMDALQSKENLGAVLEIKPTATPTTTLVYQSGTQSVPPTGIVSGGQTDASTPTDSAPTGAIPTSTSPAPTQVPSSTSTLPVLTIAPSSTFSPSDIPPSVTPASFTSTPVPPTSVPTEVPPVPTIRPNQCKDDPGHPHYCTPTP